jgi:hypothetical protein
MSNLSVSPQFSQENNDDIFKGFQPPTENWSKLPHEMIAALPLVKSLAELKVILYILRHTWGYQNYEKPRRISMDEFVNGRKNQDGGRIDPGVGMAENSVRAGLLSAIEHGFISVYEDNSDAGRVTRFYEIRPSNNATPSKVAPQKLHPKTSRVAPRTYKDKSKEGGKSNPHSKADALIDAWASAMGFDGAAIGASYNSTARRKIANAMLKWDVPPTPEEITRFVEAKVKVKPEYEFNWLEDDLPKWRKQGEKSTPPGFVSATAGLIFEN